VESLTFLGGFVLIAGLTVVLGGVLLGLLTAPVVYLSRSLSRYREFAADRAAASMTGDPATLVDAIRELDGEAEGAPTADKRRAYEGVRGLCFLPYGFQEDSKANAAEDHRFYVEARSHPPTAARIERLKSVTSSN
jgi:heat shock protein HtpX